jgi:diacylglycerol kinase
MKKFFKGFRYALTGIAYALKGRNFKIHVAAAAVILLLGIYLEISKTELMFVILLIGFVLSMETTNSAVEEICNKFHPETHPHIALIKDLAAGAVLISAITSLVIGLMIFVPYF